MTTPSPVATAPEVCRITVDGPAGRADLAIPVSTPVSALLPVLLRQVDAGSDLLGTPWVLQRLGDDPLGQDSTPETAGLRHGDVLYLRPADDPLPALHFDDVADGVAHVVSASLGRWRPELTRRLALVLACLAFAALAVALLGAGAGPATAAACGAVALVLCCGCAAAARMRADRGSVLAAGIGALVFAGLVGVTVREGPGRGYAPGLPGVLVGAGCVAALAGVLLALRALPLVVPGTVLLTAVAAAAGAGLAQGARLHGAQAAAVVAVALFVLGHFAPRIALRMARLRVPQLPHNAEELQQEIDPEPEERVARRVTLAGALLDILSVSSALVHAVAFWLLADREQGWIGWLLPLVFGLAVLLRARGTNGALQRVPAVLAGACGLGLVLVVRVAPTGVTGRGVVIAVLLAAAAALLVGAWRLPHGRLLPVWGHFGDLLETIAALALLPLLLQVLHTYAYFRGLAG